MPFELPLLFRFENTHNLIAEVVTALPVEEHVALNERRLPSDRLCSQDAGEEVGR